MTGPMSSSDTMETPAPEYRYPDAPHVPQELRGRTAAEAASMFESLMAQTAGVIPAAQPVPTSPTTNSNNYVTASQLAQVADSQAQVSYNIAARESPEIFSRWRGEIDEVLARVPRPQWSLDVIQNAVKFVKGAHVEELVSERVRALETTTHSTMRATGGGAYGAAPIQESKPADRVPEAWKRRAEAVGIGPQQVAEFCRANEITEGEFWAQFGNGNFITDAVEDVSFGRKSKS